MNVGPISASASHGEPQPADTVTRPATLGAGMPECNNYVIRTPDKDTRDFHVRCETSRSWEVMMNKKYCILAVILLTLLLFTSPASASDFKCNPTEPDIMGPFYKPGAPVRDSVGSGYVLTGTVKSAKDCSPVSDARLEVWLAGPDGRYDDEHRAALFTDRSGKYKFQSNFPPRYGFRPPHIHIRVSADGFDSLVTQHYPKKGTEKDNFDIVLIPEN